MMAFHVRSSAYCVVWVIVRQLGSLVRDLPARETTVFTPNPCNAYFAVGSNPLVVPNVTTKGDEFATLPDNGSNLLWD
jgi:hypothetical protein